MLSEQQRPNLKELNPVSRPKRETSTGSLFTERLTTNSVSLVCSAYGVQSFLFPRYNFHDRVDGRGAESSKGLLVVCNTLQFVENKYELRATGGAKLSTEEYVSTIRT